MAYDVPLQQRREQAAKCDVGLGECLYLAPRAPKIEPELMRRTLETSSAESNLVGNIYYANYYHWQGRLIERYFYNVFPEWFTAGGQLGEFWCVRSSVAHLREAMPFDQIEVVMALEGLYQRGIQLHFDFYKVALDEPRIKLAYGEYEAIWVAKGAYIRACELPDCYRSVLIGAVDCHRRTGALRA